MTYLSLSDYGVIGNASSSALISKAGSIDWCCLPFLDSPSHFASVLDETRGGRFQISPEGEFRSEHNYAQSTHVLETSFETPHGRAILTDWMPTRDAHDPVIHRRIEVIEGNVNWLAICFPRFAGGMKAEAELFRGGILFRGSGQGELAFLKSDTKFEISSNTSSAVGRFALAAGERRHFTWSWGRSFLGAQGTSSANPQETIEYWIAQSHHCPASGCPFAGPWHDLLVRSGLLLKLLQTRYAGSLAEAVAPSFPRHPGERHGWENRYSWIQNTAIGMQAFANLGYTDEASALFQWLADIIVRDGVDGIQPAYLLDGSKQFSDSKPMLPDESIRALHEFHLDTFGQVLLAATEFRRLFGALPAPFWRRVVELADYICQAWRRPDYGPWHPGRSLAAGRARPEHFVASKLFCWVVLDRAIQLAESVGERPTPRWVDERRILHRTILDQGFDSAQHSFVRSFADRELDPAALLVPLLGFLPADDIRVRGTLDAIQSQLSEGVFIHARRDPHGIDVSGPSLFFSFLYVSALAVCGRTEEARDRLAELCSYATPLGFFGDTVNLATGETRGSFPSLEVHLSLVQAAVHVAAARGRKLPLAPATKIVPATATKIA